MKLPPVTQPRSSRHAAGPIEWLPLRRLGALTMAPSPERPPHVSAASGLVVIGRSLWVAADDENHLARFDALATKPGEWLRVFEGTLPTEKEARRAVKPDFETLTAYPPTTSAANGGLLALGSGSAKNRLRGTFVPLTKTGEPLPPRSLDFGPLFTSLQQRFPELNVEGGVVSNDRLRLFHRGGEDGGNATIDVDLAAVSASIETGAPIGPSALRDVTGYELGALAGVPLGFADASALPDGTVVYVASAEDTDDPVFDGAVSGSVIGLMHPDGTLGPTFPVKDLKLEGVEARIVGDDLELLLVADADDPAIASPLLSVRLPGLAPKAVPAQRDESTFEATGPQPRQTERAAPAPPQVTAAQLWRDDST